MPNNGLHKYIVIDIYIGYKRDDFDTKCTHLYHLWIRKTKIASKINRRVPNNNVIKYQ